MPSGDRDRGSESEPQFRATAPTYVRRLKGRYQDALRAGDRRAALAVIDEAVQRRLASPLIQCEVIQPAMVWIGDLWAEGVVTIADEHLATAITEEALPQLRPALQANEAQSGKKVLLAAVEGEQHVIGLRMVADVLAGEGFDVLYLGANVPTAALAGIVPEHEPAIIGLSCTNRPATLLDALEAIDSSANEARVILGGRGVPSWLRGHPYPWVAQSAEVVNAIETLLLSPPQSLPARLHRLVRPGPRAGEVASEVCSSAGLLCDRATLDERLDLCGKNGERALVMMIEIDERIVDEQPPNTPASCPKSAVEAIVSRIRAEDLIARTGMTEVTALLLGAASEAAPQIAARLHQAADQVQGMPTSLTIGIAPVGEDPRSALLATDEALHAAKEIDGGRSAIVPAPGEPPTWLEPPELPHENQTALPLHDESFERTASRRRQAQTAPQLTKRQREVLHALSEGKSTAEIASDLFLSQVTVRNHVANLLTVLGVHSCLQAVVTAKTRGLLD